MALLLSNAILHIVGNTGTDSCFSAGELDVDSETCFEFVSKHVRRLMTNPAAREATFSAESPVYELVKTYQKGDIYFRDMSRKLCERLADIMRDNPDVPPAAVLVATFDNGGIRYLAILKLSYGECYTQRLVESENGTETQIIKNTSVLPLSASKVDEACLVPWDPMILRILEKPHSVNGELRNYFSELFLECRTELSKKETATIIHEIAEEINAKYFDDNPEVAAKIDCAVMDEATEADDAGSLYLENVANRVFRENEPAKEEFVAMAKDAGLPHEVHIDKSFAAREFKMQQIKADNGIEIKCPSELFHDPDTVQMVTNPDGTISITLKNLRRKTL